jgi:hypothetical protein
MADYKETPALWSVKRGDTTEIRLVKDEYNGRTSFTLRVFWKGDDGVWRWSNKQPDRNGKHWDALTLREGEFQSLAKFIANKAAGKSEPPPPPKKEDGDGIPF